MGISMKPAALLACRSRGCMRNGSVQGRMTAAEAVDRDSDIVVGTATAWFEVDAEGRGGDAQGAGRVHWVSVVPEAQGCGLAKAR